MSAELHPCPKNDCPEQLPFELMACKAHWFALPPELRRRINTAWRTGDVRGTIHARREVDAWLNGSSEVTP